MQAFTGLGKKVALISAPLMLGSLLNKAYGQAPTSSVIDVLNFALTLEYLEYEFYLKATDSAGLIPAGAATPTFDFSGGNGTGTGPFASAFSNYQLFLAVAQTLEDTGVRAYKGQAGNLINADDVLEAALNIHSVEARHASHVRQMRKANNFGDVKPWITGKDTSGIGALVQANYNGEELTTQAGVNIINIGGQSISANAASESFDEPLTTAEVLALVDAFIV